MLDNDNDLINQYFQGDVQSLDLLIKKYLRLVYNFVFRIVGDVNEAENIAQEVWLRAWKNLKKFDQKKSFKTWLLAIAKNAAFDYLKKKKTINFSALEDVDGNNPTIDNLADLESLPDEVFDRANLGEEVNKLLDKVSIIQKTVLLLYFKEQLTFQEIADLLNESIDTVKSRYRRALIKLKEVLLKNK